MALKKLEPTLYAYFRDIRRWDIRSSHMVKNLPKQYVFMLTPCFQNICLHKICQNQESGQKYDLKWSPNGLSLDYFPLPIPDPKRPWGGQCSSCKGKCAGHFLNQVENFEH